MAGIRQRWLSLFWPGLFALVAFSLLCGLGIWQLQRLAWKNALQAQITERAFGEAVSVPPQKQWTSWRPEKDEFRRVFTEGVFDHAKQVLVHGLATPQRRVLQGFYVLTPLKTQEGIILVNRGFVPSDQIPALQNPQGPVRVVGLMRAPEQQGWFVPDNAPAAEDWYTRSIADIARARQIDPAPFLIDADKTGTSWPLGGLTPVALTNNHLSYALTWFGLAGALMGVFVWRVRSL